jgi:hypothetical protein
VVSVTDPSGHILGFLDRSRYFFFQVAGSWVDPRAGLDNMEKRKFLTLPGLRLISLLSSSPYPVAIPTELLRLDASFKYLANVIYRNTWEILGVG